MIDFLSHCDMPKLHLKGKRPGKKNILKYHKHLVKQPRLADLKTNSQEEKDSFFLQGDPGGETTLDEDSTV